jgi:hypothetical protein
LEHLLFATYLILFAWLITKVKFFTNSGLTNSQLIILFLLKVMAGILYGWIGVYYGEMAKMLDTWAYQYMSLEETELLKHHPVDFFTSLFRSSYQSGYGKFFSTHSSWWNDLKANLFIKVMAIFNLLSFGHYYVNVVFYSFLSLFGPIAIFRVMKDIFPAKKTTVLLATFLIPSFLYWTSGLHKEGLIFVGLAMICYHFYFGFKQKRFPAYRVAIIIFNFLIVLALRNFMVVTLLPALLAWVVSSKVRFKPVLTYSIIYSLFLIFFFTAKYIYPPLDLPNEVVIKQTEFLGLGGNSAVEVSRVEPNFTSFLINSPQAFSLSILRPYPSDVHHLLSLAAATEIGILLLLFFLSLFFGKRQAELNPTLLFFLFFSLSVLMMIGYSVNVLGAIVRYRSIVFPFLIVPLVVRIDWNRIYRLVSGDINFKNNV